MATSEGIQPLIYNTIYKHNIRCMVSLLVSERTTGRNQATRLPSLARLDNSL